MSFIDGYLIEINQFPRNNDDLFTIKDYFYYDSNTTQYGHRDTVIPKECVENYFDIPDESTMKSIINRNVPIMKRVIDINNQKETWFFQTSNLKGLENNDY
jgi:hypothetical protein